MPISIRRYKVTDLIEMQQANCHCLPENYQMWYWLYHYLMNPETAHVAVDSQNRLIGYVLGRVDDDGRNKKPAIPAHGSITSVAVYNGYRKFGLATKLLLLTHRSFKEVYRMKYVNLNVRETNRGGQICYYGIGYKLEKVEQQYYCDDENGLLLRYTFEGQ